MAIIKEITAKTILGKSGIMDYCVNCYVGCEHNCVYCYAQYMTRFSGHQEPWGKFVDAKCNAPEILNKEVKRKNPGGVILSSVCDPYQPVEKRFELTRRCLKILTDAGFPISILTKSDLVMRDYDILAGFTNCHVGCTITTLDEHLRFKMEPGASTIRQRFNVLEKAAEKGIPIWVFLGPFLPGISDSDEAISNLLTALEPLPLTQIYADKLNPKYGLWNRMAPFIHKYFPDLYPMYQRYFFDRSYYREYFHDFRKRIHQIAKLHTNLSKIPFNF